MTATVEAHDARPAWTRYVRHTATCWAYARGLWCHDCDAADFDADVEARAHAERSIAEARARYLRVGRHEREHAAYCDRPQWACWTYLGRLVEAASVELDMLNAERLVGRYPRIGSKGIAYG